MAAEASEKPSPPILPPTSPSHFVLSGPLVVVWGGLEEDIVSDPSRDLQAAFYGVAGLQ